MKSRSHITGLYCAILLTIAGGVSYVRAEDASSRGKGDIRAEIMRLNRGEKESFEALDALKRRPRAEVLAILRDDLQMTPKIPSSSLRAISALEARELLPELRPILKRNEGWQLFSTVNRLLDSRASGAEITLVSDIYVNRLRGWLPAPAKAAALDGLESWKVALPADLYRQLMDDSNFEVRRSALNVFISARESLSTDDEISRWKLAFQVKPYQVRLEAMERFLALPIETREKLKGAVNAQLCRGEEKAEVKPTCLKLVSSVTKRADKKPAGGAK